MAGEGAGERGREGEEKIEEEEGRGGRESDRQRMEKKERMGEVMLIK